MHIHRAIAGGMEWAVAMLAGSASTPQPGTAAPGDRAERRPTGHPSRLGSLVFSLKTWAGEYSTSDVEHGVAVSPNRAWMLGLLALLGALGRPAPAAAGPAAVLFSHGQARCYLDVTADQARRLRVEAAVADLTACFKRMTGAPLPRSEGSGPGPSGRIPLRLELAAYPAGASRYDARTTQGFEIRVGPSEVRLRACTSLGLTNAVYSLLDRWGCRWVLPGELGECIPRRAQLTLRRGTLSFAPRNDMAVEVRGGGAVGDWYRRNLAGSEHWLSGQHFWSYAIPPKPNFQEHPDWYSLIGGERRPRQLCTSNPEVIVRMIQVARSYLRAESRPPAFPIDPDDTIEFCQCARCVAQDVPGAQTDGAPTMTDRVLTFANAVAAGIREEFPDRCVAFCAYWTHLDPPRRVRPAPNVAVLICRSSSCLLHLTPTAACRTSDFHALVRRWRELTPNIYTYEYDPISWNGELPSPTYLEMARSLQTQLNRLGVKGSFSDTTMVTPETSASWYVNHYLARRMKVDPSQDPGAVLRDLCRAFFGPAAAPMEAYYRELARATGTAHPGKRRIGFGITFYHEIFPPRIVEPARARLRKAQSLVAGRDPYATRVEMVAMSQRYLDAYLDGVWAAQKHRYPDSVAAFDRMDRAITELAAHGYINAEDARFRAAAMRMKALAESFPAQLGYVTGWKLLGPFDNSDRDAHLRRDPFEPVASLNAPVIGRDGSAAGWWDYESRGGFLNLESAFAAKKGKWSLSYGYAALSYEAPRAGGARILMDSFFPFKLSVNGEDVFDRPGLNFDCPDRYAIPVTLRAGHNVIVVKLSHTQLAADQFPWGLYLRVVPDAARG